MDAILLLEANGQRDCRESWTVWTAEQKETENGTVCKEVIGGDGCYFVIGGERTQRSRITRISVDDECMIMIGLFELLIAWGMVWLIVTFCCCYFIFKSHSRRL